MKIVLHVAVGMCNARDVIEIPDEEWNAMTEAQRNAECDSYLEGHMSNNVEASWWPEAMG